jgi:UMF1 family MFS transporter
MMSGRATIPSAPFQRQVVFAWALYDWGNSAFVTSVLVGFFPLLFNTVWSVDVDGATTTARLMVVNGLASLCLAFAAPVAGAIADRAGWRKRFLGLFALVGAVATVCLGGMPDGWWQGAAFCFGLASFGFFAANVFYDAMLVDVAPAEHYDRVSGLGFALGYLGGGIALAGHLVLTSSPHVFGFADTQQAARAVFPTVAVWWGLFTLPLLITVREQKPHSIPTLRSAVQEGMIQLLATFRRVRQLRSVAVFLVAYWLYIDGVNTVMKAAIDFGYKLGVGPRDLMLALLLVQFVGFPATMIFAWCGQRIGARQALGVGLAVYIGVTTWAAFMKSAWEFYVVAGAVGLVQGGVFSLSRSFYARLIPADESAEFFGFFNMVGKFAAVLGPLLVAGAAMATGSSHAAVAAVLPLLVAGGLVLWFVPPPIAE